MIKLIKNKKHQVQKRSGRLEDFNPEKLNKVILWACEGNETFAKMINDALSIKIYNKIPIEKLYDEVIATASNFIGPMVVVFDKIAARLLLLKYYKEVAGLKKTGVYPNLKEFIETGIFGDVYSKEVFDSFTKEDIQELNSIISPDKDFNYNFSGLFFMNSKYCKKTNNRVQFELPQVTYMRSAMYAFHKDFEDDNQKRLEFISKYYNILSDFKETAGTPRILNSGTINSQLASCVLNTPDDDTDSINDCNKNIGKYSKFGGGIAIDVSRIRASGAVIKGNNGYSSGPVPFIKEFEQTISSFDQAGTRKGSAVITYPFWHYDVQDLLVLKDAGGTEDNRARKLQYAIKLQEIFFERVQMDSKITLFDPVDVPDLIEATGEDFIRIYKRYEKTPGIRKRKVQAKELAFNFIKNRAETGNLYVTFLDNINSQNAMNWHVGASNLCQEITVRSKPSMYLKDEFNLETGIQKVTKQLGEIGLCNLSSVNLVEYIKMTPEEKDEFLYIIMRAADNLIDLQFYPIAEGEYSNKRNRPIGIGVSNYVNAMALEGIAITDPEALKWTHEIFEDLNFRILKASVELAKERGAFDTFDQSKWAQGQVPIDWSILHNTEDSGKNKLNFDLNHDWDWLRGEIKKHGVRFSLHQAIAPTSSSGKIIGATESIEPIHDLFSIQEGTITLPTLVPNLIKNRAKYVKAFEVPAKTLIDLAAIRQKFLDQSQSVNLYYVDPSSAKELYDDIEYAKEMGLKTLYYMKTPKSNYVSGCESCSS